MQLPHAPPMCRAGVGFGFQTRHRQHGPTRSAMGACVNAGVLTSRGPDLEIGLTRPARAVGSEARRPPIDTPGEGAGGGTKNQPGWPASWERQGRAQLRPQPVLLLSEQTRSKQKTKAERRRTWKGPAGWRHPAPTPPPSRGGVGFFLFRVEWQLRVVLFCGLSFCCVRVFWLRVVVFRGLAFFRFVGWVAVAGCSFLWLVFFCCGLLFLVAGLRFCLWWACLVGPFSWCCVVGGWVAANEPGATLLRCR